MYLSRWPLYLLITMIGPLFNLGVAARKACIPCEKGICSSIQVIPAHAVLWMSEQMNWYNQIHIKFSTSKREDSQTQLKNQKQKKEQMASRVGNPFPKTVATALVEKYSVSLKTLLQQGISKPEFYDGLAYRFRKIVGNLTFRSNSENYLTVIKELAIAWICLADCMPSC